MSWEVEQIGPHTLIRGDCREIVSTLTGVDAVITDPPYGIAFGWESRRQMSRRCALAWRGAGSAIPMTWERLHGDQEPFDPTPLVGYAQVILWGGHLFAGLPPARGWLVWDKRCGMVADHHGDAELAWTNLSTVIRVHRQIWRGVVREGEENAVHGGKVHPTQKPVALMRWCVEMTTGTVLDPYMGSGTTLVACAQLGRAGVGVEISRQYFDIACQRMHDALAQPDLFVPTPTPVQQRLFAGVLP